MRRLHTVATGDYTATPAVQEHRLNPGVYSLRRVVAGIYNSTVDATVGVYRAASGLTSLTDLVRETGEVYYADDAIPATGGVPSLNDQTDALVTIRASESLYTWVKAFAPDTAINGLVQLEIVGDE